MNFEETKQSKKYIDFLLNNLTESQHESMMIKFAIKDKIDFYVGCGMKIQDGIKILTKSGFNINGRNIILAKKTIFNYYYNSK